MGGGVVCRTFLMVHFLIGSRRSLADCSLRQLLGQEAFTRLSLAREYSRSVQSVALTRISRIHVSHEGYHPAAASTQIDTSLEKAEVKEDLA